MLTAYADRACPRPPKCFCTLCRISYKRSMPMLCPSIGDDQATPLLSQDEILSCPQHLVLAVNDHWTGLLEWTTGLTFFALKIIFMPYNKICLPCIWTCLQLLLSSIFWPYVDRQQSLSACSNCNADWSESSIHNVDMRVFILSLETVASLGW